MTKDVWPASGTDELKGFEITRSYFLRATRNAFERFYKEHFTGEETVLEIGAGMGFLRRNWPSQFSGTWIELEPQLAFLKETKRKLSLNGNAYQLPFADNSLDVVCGYGSFDVLLDLESAVKEAHRVLKPEGLFFHMLDLGANRDAITKHFRDEKIPIIISRKTNSFAEILAPAASKTFSFQYIPEQNRDSFFEEVGSSQEEIKNSNDATDSAFKAYLRKEGFDFETDEVDIIIKYQEFFQIFEKYSEDLDLNQYFNDRLVSHLSSNFRFVCDDKLVGNYSGKRTKQQAEIGPNSFVFEKHGRLPLAQPCRKEQALGYVMYQSVFSEISYISKWLEPRVHEKSIIDCVIARK